MREIILSAIESPDYLLEGWKDEILAVKQIAIGKMIVVVYKEELDEGFIITAYTTRRVSWLSKRRRIWEK
jgi:hypothetical protein